MGESTLNRTYLVVIMMSLGGLSLVPQAEATSCSVTYPMARATRKAPTVAVALVAGLLLVAGSSAADTDFSETFGGATDGCVAGAAIYSWNNWLGPNITVESDLSENFALCDVSTGEWGVSGNKFVTIRSSPGSVGSGWAKHAISPTGAWELESHIYFTCSLTWGTVFFSLLEGVGMARVGFADNDYSLDIQDGSTIAYDQVALSCPNPFIGSDHWLKLTFSSATATNYNVYLDNTLVGNYDTSSTTTPSYVRFGTETASANEQGQVSVDNISVRDNL